MIPNITKAKPNDDDEKKKKEASIVVWKMINNVEN